MSSPAFVRLGPSSADLSKKIDVADAGPYPDSITLTCAQVPQQFGAGSPLWLWLGSDNNKGVATTWSQGIRAIGRCKANVRVTGTNNYQVEIGDLFLLPRSVSKIELLETSPETYARGLADASIVGLNNYSSQVVQVLSDEEFATIGGLIAEMIPEARDSISAFAPGIEDIKIIPRTAEDEVAPPAPPPAEAALPPYAPEIDDDDPVYQQVRRLFDEDNWGGVILLGAPGTGKSWYARQIAIKLTGGDRSRMREIQFHASYQYEDFIEGYVPKGSTGFSLKDKHLIEMIDVAKSTDGPVVLVIDEFSRTDPARVLGEALTYMEGSLRGIEFSLPSGRKISIPPNLFFLATMNPEDRSVDEIDAAMDRRWAKVHLRPELAHLRVFLDANGVTGRLKAATIEFFSALQKKVEIGHAFFRTVKDEASLRRLWEHQLQFIVKKRFRFDTEAQAEISTQWAKCLASIAEPPSETAAEPVEDAGPDGGAEAVEVAQ